MAPDVPVRVFARPRPRQEEDGYPECMEVQEGREEIWIRPETKEQTKICPADQNFVFDGVLTERATTQDLVYSRCAEKVVSTVLEGFNGTVMCYGQTGAGKTYTMSGKVGDITNLEAFHAMSEGPDRGIMQRAVEQVFKAKAQMNSGGQMGAGGVEDKGKAKGSVEVSLKMSYIEIYNDIVHDLIQEDTNSIALRKSVAGKESAASTPQMRNGASCHSVSSRDQAMELLHLGLRRRQVAAHNLNRDSSRSHAILTLYVTRGSGKRSAEAGKGGPKRGSASSDAEETIQSRLDLVDLAGSERLSKTQSSGVHQSEAQHINKSLSFLEQVVLAIGDPNRDHIPYRTCKLTQFLKESLGGNSYTVFVANVRLESSFLSETVRTCRFAQRMLNVKNSPILNVMRNDKNVSQYIQKLVDENNHLKEELALYDSLSQVNREYEPYTDEQRAILLEQLERYFLNDSWSVNNFSPLEFSSVRHIKEIILQCKAIYNRTSVPSSESAGPSAPSIESQPLSLGHENGHGSVEGRHHNNGGADVYSEAGSYQSESPQALPRSQSNSSNGSALDPAKIEIYKEGVGKQLQEALDENRMLVKTKKKESNMLAKQMNELIKRIKASEDKTTTQDLKAEYRELHQERAMLLSEIDHCKSLAAECSKKLKEGVHECFQ
ncbi:kinesin [Chloropicon primus]|uniref:Kinesin-like protein n=2 Tax=Chloropicon primus TaxID=1764295 RepID=A0A5B8MMP2_9CHLO|nr:kinesin [Chloropicon primus]UPR00530.1 kinesin [Chloropicon primus]|eukprot:QDZ21314.1 kinesin [Chloropicon primus]